MDLVAFNHGLTAETDAELERELLTLNAHMSAATYRFLMLVRTFDARVAWGDFGMRPLLFGKGGALAELALWH